MKQEKTMQYMNKKRLFVRILSLLLLLNPMQGLLAQVQERTELDGQLLLQDIPPISNEITQSLARYHDTRSTLFMGFTPDSKNIYIKTRFDGVNQIHRVERPGRERTQVTFAEEPIGEAVRQPGGELIAFAMDEGGSGFDQIMLFNPVNGETRLLTDGKSLNNRMVWDNTGTKLAYRSTRRNGKNNDIWIMDIDAPEKARMLFGSTDGALWKPVDFSADGILLLVQYYAGITDSRIYILNLESGALKLLVGAVDQPTSSVASGFNHDDSEVLFVTNKRGNAAEIGSVPVSGEGPFRFVEDVITWDVSEFELSPDGKRGAFVTNEEGISKLYLFDPEKMRYERVRRTPIGEISSLRFSPDGRRLGMTLSTAQTPNDAFVLMLRRKPLSFDKLVRWTIDDVGGLNPDNFIQPKLVHFPARMLTNERIILMPAFVYQPKGKGPFPVVIYVHGGPEGQFRPSFNGQIQMWVEKLGVAVIAPNVRGSLGYGESYLEMDDGLLRENAVKDIGFLLDWIEIQKKFDHNRVAVYGASYGGYMSLASAVHYSDRIKGAIARAGISNFVTYLENTQSYRRDLRRIEYGDERIPEMRAFLESISPLTNVDKIHTPLLIATGQNDPVVPASESMQMVNALRKNGLPVWYMNALNEGHMFEKKENRDYFQTVTYLFLKQYLFE
ncbi:MAG: dipeptidyl aminopeptidase/acylaminoacyl peptidase [Lysobacterales bacterium]|jgi:dipeptidyl aminopeptidase/acylaminoacyl peptidase